MMARLRFFPLAGALLLLGLTGDLEPALDPLLPPP